MKPANYLRQILFILGEDRRKLPVLGFAVLVSSLLDTLGIGLIGPFVALAADPSLIETHSLGRRLAGFLGTDSPGRVIAVFGVALVVLFYVKAGVALSIQYLLTRFARRQQVRLRSKLLQIYQHMPYSRHLLRSSAESIETILPHVNTFSGPCLLVSMRLVAEGCVVIALFTMLACTSWVSVAVLLGLLGAVAFVYDRLFRRRMKEMGRLASVSNVRMVRGIQQALEGLKEIRVLGRESYFHDEVREGALQYARATAQQQIIQAMPRYLTESVLLTFVIGMVLAAQARGAGLESIAPLLAMFGIAGVRILPSTNLLLTGMNQLRFARYPVDSLYAAMQQLESAPIEVVPAKRPSRASSQLQVLELKGVGFKYPNATEWALDGVDLAIRRGESIGLVGPSGSGKTTALDVLLGLLEPQRGEVLFNGRPVRDDPRAWLDQVGYLPQMVFLIDDSLRANVALGVPASEIDDDLVREALRHARLSDLVPQLPRGLETKIGERGVRLSGGQRQRVALARAFYHGREVLVMDEATSALDNETERQIVDEIRRLKGQKTLVVIAHRLSTVEHCDRIYRLERGRVVRVGPFEDLVPSGAPAELAAPERPLP